MAEISLQNLKNSDDDIYLAIGDIHGCWMELEHMLSALGNKFDLESPNVHLIFLGDYIDRGDSSLRVLQRLVQLQEQLPKTVFLTGNHERMFIDAVESRFENDLPEKLDSKLLTFMSGLHFYHQVPGFLFIHGGPLDSTSDLASMDKLSLLWNYEPDLAGWQNNIVVRGHYRVNEVKRTQNLISVDTGCCFGGKLSCVMLKQAEGLISVLSVPRIFKLAI